MPADSFEGIWTFIARPNLCGTPACCQAATTLCAMQATVRCASGFWAKWDNVQKN